MNITVYSGFSKRRNSTKQPTGGRSITCTLKHPTSVIHPVFLIQNFDLSDNYLEWNNRFYFIDDIVVENNNMASYHCSVDALASWKTAISGLSEFVARSASSFDGKLIDSLYPAKAGVTVDRVNFNTLNASVASFRVSGGGGYYIVGVYSAGGGTGAITYYILSPSEFSQVVSYMLSDVWLDDSETDITIATQKQLINPMQYIASCFWYPFDGLSGVGSGDMFSFGFWQTNVGAKMLDVSDRKFILNDYVTAPAHPESGTRGKYLSDSPYTRRTITCWGFGQIPIDPSGLVDVNTLSVQIDVDLFTGAGTMQIIAGLDLIGTYHAQLGVPIQLAQLSQDIQNSLVSGLGAIGSALTLNALGAVSGVFDSIESWIPKMNVSGSTGSAVDYMFTPNLESEFKIQAPMDAVHNGRPLCQQTTIGSLSGYIKTENADVDLPCTQEERDQIAGYMDGGFYFE